MPEYQIVHFQTAIQSHWAAVDPETGEVMRDEATGQPRLFITTERPACFTEEAFCLAFQRLVEKRKELSDGKFPEEINGADSTP